VWTPHNLFDRFGAGYPRSRDITRRWAARMIVHAEYDRRQLPPASAANAVVIPHGEYGGLTRRAPTQDDPAESRAALGLPEDAIVVLLFGHLRPDKGVRDIALAAREVPEVHLLLAGLDQGGLDDAADVLESPELRERVTVREGFVPFEEMGRVFAASDVAAVPYHVASASGVLLLSYAYKLPVVAYPVGGLPEYVSNGETGWLCPAQDPAALADSLRDVVARGRDECRARGEAALRYSHTHFSWDEIARRTTELYVNVLNRT
jgi:glycosyltransferase involved in cell wall biosynthesis